MAVSFHKADITFRLSKSKLLSNFISKNYQEASGKRLMASYVLCSDEYLLQISQSFLGHDYYTDIVTFPLSDTDKSCHAEIYISIDRVRDNATKHKVEFEHELLRVIFHGVLHLLGHPDKTKAQKALMRSMEEKWIEAYAHVKSAAEAV